MFRVTIRPNQTDFTPDESPATFYGPEFAHDRGPAMTVVRVPNGAGYMIVVTNNTDSWIRVVGYMATTIDGDGAGDKCVFRVQLGPRTTDHIRSACMTPDDPTDGMRYVFYALDAVLAAELDAGCTVGTQPRGAINTTQTAPVRSGIAGVSLNRIGIIEVTGWLCEPTDWTIVTEWDDEKFALPAGDDKRTIGTVLEELGFVHDHKTLPYNYHVHYLSNDGLLTKTAASERQKLVSVDELADTPTLYVTREHAWRASIPICVGSTTIRVDATYQTTVAELIKACCEKLEPEMGRTIRFTRVDAYNSTNVSLCKGTLGANGIDPCDTLYGSFVSSFPIFVKTLSGTTDAITVTLADLISAVKEMIKCALGCPVDQQRLVYNGRELSNDDATVAACDIVPDSTLHMILRLRGGGGGTALQLAVQVESDEAVSPGAMSLLIDTFGTNHSVNELCLEVARRCGVEAGQVTIKRKGRVLPVHARLGVAVGDGTDPLYELVATVLPVGERQCRLGGTTLQGKTKQKRRESLRYPKPIIKPSRQEHMLKLVVADAPVGTNVVPGTLVGAECTPL